MIKSVTLYNFESHEDAKITFTDNLNLIIGQSNSGKSSLIRAMGVVVNNNWTKEMVRTGSDFCRVTLETERGWVEAERGEKINRWRCQENGQEIQSFKNVGTKVPELATKILGMGERDRGGDIKELPNFQFQLEKHYMLSEIGEKKSTSNMIARMMDNAIGLGGMEDLIKDISSDLLKDKKWLTEKQNEIIELKSSIIDENIFNTYTTLINNINKTFTFIESLKDDIDVASKYKNKYDEVYDAKSNNDKIISTICELDFDKICLLKEELDKLFQQIKDIEKINFISTEISKKSSILEMDIEKFIQLQNDCDRLNKIIELCIYSRNIQDDILKIQNITNLDLSKIQILQDELIQNQNKIKEAELKLEFARDLWKTKVSHEKEISKLTIELNKHVNEFELLKDELGVCPLCGNKLN